VLFTKQTKQEALCAPYREGLVTGFDKSAPRHDFQPLTSTCWSLQPPELDFPAQISTLSSSCSFTGVETFAVVEAGIQLVVKDISSRELDRGKVTITVCITGTVSHTVTLVVEALGLHVLGILIVSVNGGTMQSTFGP